VLFSRLPYYYYMPFVVFVVLLLFVFCVAAAVVVVVVVVCVCVCVFCFLNVISRHTHLQEALMSEAERVFLLCYFIVITVIQYIVFVMFVDVCLAILREERQRSFGALPHLQEALMSEADLFYVFCFFRIIYLLCCFCCCVFVLFCFVVVVV